MNLKFSSKPVSFIVLCAILLTGCVTPPSTPAVVSPPTGPAIAPATSTPLVPTATATFPPTKAPPTSVPATATTVPLGVTVTAPPATATVNPFGNLILPPELAGARIVLPLGLEERTAAKSRIEAAMRQSGVPVDAYNTDLVVAYPEGAGIGKYQEYAAPARQSFDKLPPGQPVMALWDEAGLNQHGSLVYEVSFDGQTALLQNRSQSINISRPAYFADQKEVARTTMALFAQGSCYICWDGDERAACLICFP